MNKKTNLLRMVKFLSLLILYCNFSVQSNAQGADFVQGAQVIFQDQFASDPVGDLPAQWSSSGDGEVVKIGRTQNNWFHFTSPTSVSPELNAALPENFTIEFDLFLKPTSGVAPIIMFGLTGISDVASSDVYRNNIFVKITGYNEGNNAQVVYGKNIDDIGSKTANAITSSIGRSLHVSLSVNGSRFRVYFGSQKLIDMPKIVTQAFLGNFFIAAPTVIPAPEEGVYISNVRIASGDADARSLLINQLLEQGSATTTEISFDPQNNNLQSTSYPLLDTLGTAMVNDPNLNIQINGADANMQNNYYPASATGKKLQELAQQKVDKIKQYLIDKFNLGVERVMASASQKIMDTTGQIENGKAAKKLKGFITQFVKQ